MEKNQSDEKEEVPFIANVDEKKPESSLRFGWGKFRPDCLQIFNGPKCFLFMLVFFSAAQGNNVSIFFYCNLLSSNIA
jgi:hypothetical protein